MAYPNVPTPDTDWHYPRAALARQLLDGLATQLVSAQALYAPRRMGKTTFLLEDLKPAAETRGWRVAYGNLWLDRDDPLRIVVGGLRQARSAMRRLMTVGISKVKLSASVRGEIDAEVEVKERAASRAATVDELGRLLDQLGKRNKPLLLLLDEAQVLSANETGAAALRALLDTRKRTVKVIFTGSSEDALRRLFALERQPFYRWAPVREFDRLGPDFVEFQVRLFQRVSRHTLDLRRALAVFDELHQVPEYFRRFLQALLLSTTGDVAAALANAKNEILSSSGEISRLTLMHALDRAILKHIALQGGSNLSSVESVRTLNVALGQEGVVTPSAVKNSLRRLLRDSVLVRPAHGSYQFEDLLLQDWLRANKVR